MHFPSAKECHQTYYSLTALSDEQLIPLLVDLHRNGTYYKGAKPMPVDYEKTELMVFRNTFAKQLTLYSDLNAIVELYDYGLCGLIDETNEPGEGDCLKFMLIDTSNINRRIKIASLL